MDTVGAMIALRWVRTKSVVEVSFVKWMRNESLRHAEFLVIRTVQSGRPRYFARTDVVGLVRTMVRRAYRVSSNTDSCERARMT
jgi:hypothetical protein